MIASAATRTVQRSSRRARCLTIATLEFRLQLVSPLFWALLALLVAAISTLNPVAMMRGAAADGASRVFANSVWALSPSLAMSGFFVYPFFASIMAGLAALRDDDVGMSELLESTPLTTREHAWAKYAGVMTALGVAIVVHLLVLVAFRELSIGGTARGPFRLSAYLVPAMLFTVPTALWSAGLSFAIVSRTRQAMWAYALPVLLFVTEFLWLWNWHPAGISRVLDSALMLLDPTGLRWITYRLFETDPGLTVVNTQPLTIDATLVVGRLLAVLLPMGAIALSTRRGRLQRWVRARRTTAVVRATGASATSSATPMRSALTTMLADALPVQRRAPTVATGSMTVLWAELRELMRRPSVYISTLLLFMVVADVGGADADAFGSLPLLTGGGVAVAALPAVTVLSCLFLLFTLVELMHRDQSSGFAPLAMSSSTPTAAFLIGRGLASLALQVILTLASVASAAVLLYAQSGSTHDLWPLWLVFGGVLGPTALLWVSFVTMVMSATRSRAATLAIGFGALLMTAAQFVGGTLTWLTNWPVFGALRWTEFAVFPLDGAALLTNRVLAVVLSVVFFVVACRVFERTERDPVSTRERWRVQRLRRTLVSCAPLLGLPLLVGGFLGIRIHEGRTLALEAQVASRALTADARANDTWSPVIRRIDLAIALQPADHGMEVSGWYDVVNESRSLVDHVPFRIPRALGPVDFVVIQRGAAPRTSVMAPTPRADLHLVRPLRVGDTVRIRFRYSAVVPRGYSRNGGETDAFILPTAVYLSTHRGDFLPEIIGSDGAQDDARLIPAARSDTPTEGFNGGRSFTVSMRVSAPKDLVVNGVGTKERAPEADDRTTTMWVSAEPVAAINLLAGRYAVQRRDGVAVFHLPAHAKSVPVMLETLAAARTSYSAWFAPYPWPELRLSEYPNLNTQATSFPTNIAVSEALSFLADTLVFGGLPFAVTAHEAAHQWWGHLLAAGDGPGTGMLIEGMADYSTLLLAEQRYGSAARAAMAVRFEAQYLQQRVAQSERSLMETSETSAPAGVVLQKKGAMAMWMLHQHLGAERTFSALQEFIRQHRSPPSFATLEALMQALRAQSADSVAFDQLVAQVVRSTALPEFAVSDPRCEPQGARFRCTARVRNRGQGHWRVDVAVLVGDRIPVGGRRTIQVQTGGTTPVDFTLDERPEHVVVDPDVHVLQVGRAQARATFRGVRSARSAVK